MNKVLINQNKVLINRNKVLINQNFVLINSNFFLIFIFNGPLRFGGIILSPFRRNKLFHDRACFNIFPRLKVLGRVLQQVFMFRNMDFSRHNSNTHCKKERWLRFLTYFTHCSQFPLSISFYFPFESTHYCFT